MILNLKPLSIAEVKEHVKDLDETKQIHNYIRKFGKMDKKKAQEIAEKVRALNNNKINEANITKVIDFLPKTSEDVNKIFSEVSLNEQEANAILEITKEY